MIGLLAFLCAALSAQQTVQTGARAVEPVPASRAFSGPLAPGGRLQFSLSGSASLASSMPQVRLAPKVDARQMTIPFVDVASELAPAPSLSAPAAQGQPVVPVKANVEQARTLVAAEGPKQTEGPSRWQRFWSGAPKAKASEEVAGAEGAAAPSLAAHEGRKAAKSAIPLPAALAGGTALAAIAAAPHEHWGWIGHILAQIKPYTEAGAILAGTYAANRAVNWAVKKIALRRGWDPNTSVVARLAASAVTWSAGIATGLHFAGVSTHALLTGFGIGGIAVSMAAKDFMGNLLVGIKVLLLHPFLIGEKVKIGDSVYTVSDMSLRYVELKKDDGSVTKMLYTQLDEKPITIFRPYASRFGEATRLKRLSLLQDLNIVKRATMANVGKSTLWLAAGLALIPGLNWLKAAYGLGALAGLFPYLKGGLVLLTTRAVENWISALVTAFAGHHGLSRQATVVVKLVLQVLAYAVGGGIALGLFGVSGTALLASFGATSLVVGWAASDVLSNLITGASILFNRPFRIGDTIEVGANKGVVMDMSVNYVVLKSADDSYTLLPYSLFKGSPVTVLPPETKK